MIMWNISQRGGYPSTLEEGPASKGSTLLVASEVTSCQIGWPRDPKSPRVTYLCLGFPKNGGTLPQKMGGDFPFYDHWKMGKNHGKWRKIMGMQEILLWNLVKPWPARSSEQLRKSDAEDIENDDQQQQGEAHRSHGSSNGLHFFAGKSCKKLPKMFQKSGELFLKLYK